MPDTRQWATLSTSDFLPTGSSGIQAAGGIFLPLAIALTLTG
jgi:hypothetical protein